MFKNIRHAILFKYHPLVIELFSVMLCILWGSWLLFPTDTFASSSAYSSMASLAPDYVWGGFILLVGIVQARAFTKNKINTRTNVMIISACFWAFVTTMFLSASFFSTAVPVYGIITLFSIWASTRLLIIKNLTQ